jgi:hypothetical protein
MTASDLLRALGPVVDALQDIGVAHYVGGSLASSTHGVPRSSIDADVVADLRIEHASPLGDRLRDRYYLNEDRMRASVEARRSFNLIHLDSAGGEVSDRQWTDVVGILRTLDQAIDHGYLERWAASLGVEDLLDRARREVAT